MEIEVDRLDRPDVIALLRDHLENMKRLSPPESVHALDLASLGSRDVTFWTAREKGVLLGCGALKELDSRHGELKSMKTAVPHQRKGVAKSLVIFIMEEAKRRGYSRLSLETGSMEAFAPARGLYQKCGFTFCRPFGEYEEDPNSVFMTMDFESRRGSTIPHH